MGDRDRVNFVLDELARVKLENAELRAYARVLEELLGVHLLGQDGETE